MKNKKDLIEICATLEKLKEAFHRVFSDLDDIHMNNLELADDMKGKAQDKQLERVESIMEALSATEEIPHDIDEIIISIQNAISKK
jgi:3-deoxy-D-arabino-heptulosonate 7-phosphate (DAHP) synthase class II